MNDRDLVCYVEEMGMDSLERQREALAARCPHCWAMPGQPHVSLCPDAPEEPEPTPDQAGLF